MERLSFLVVVFGIALLAVFLPQLYDQQLDIAEAGDGSQGTPWTVCAVGCDFTTLTSAFSDVTVQAGDYINVDATYASSTETFPLDFNSKQNITVSCQSSGAIVGTDIGAQVDIQMTSSSAFNDCTLSNTRLYFDGVSSATISGNTFATSTTGTIYFASTAGSGNTISDNTGINNIVVGSNQQSLTIASNTIHTYHATANASSLFVEGGSEITITSNTIHSFENTNVYLIFTSSTDNVSVQQNALTYDVPPTIQNIYGIAVYDAASSTISYNTILLPSEEGHALQWGNAIKIYRITTSTAMTSYITHNTIWEYASLHAGVTVDDYAATTAAMNITATYNIFYNASTTNSLLGYGLKIYKDNASSTYTLTNDYNGYHNVSNRVYDDNQNDTFVPTVGENAVFTNPYFKLGDASSTNDTELAPFSTYLDVNGTLDIGAYSTARGSSFTVDDNGIIDYASIHATSTSVMTATIVDGDTWNLAAGSYGQFALASSSRFTGNATIAGAGATTIVQPTSQASAVQFTNLTNPILQDVVVQQASTTASFYAIDGLSFDYSGNSYNDTSVLGYASDGYTFVIEQNCTDPQTTIQPTTDNDITAVTGMGTDDYHLALIDYAQGGKSIGPGTPVYVTMLVPSSVAVNQAAFEALDDCPTPDVWIDSAFAVSGGTYTYDSAAVSTAGVTVTSGYTDPPAIDRTVAGMAGVRLIDTSNATIENVTSTGNYYGISFEGTSESNTVSSSVLASSVLYDVFSTSTLNNTLSNVSFVNTSSSISGIGTINVRFASRVLVQNSGATPLEGVTVKYYSTSYLDASGSDCGDCIIGPPSATLATDVTGYTSYTNPLSGYTMSSSSVATTNGSSNPYLIIATATSTYGDTFDTNVILDQTNETFTLTMYDPPIAPTNFTTSSVATSSIIFSWTDNSVDENNFYIQYSQGTFPAFGTSIAADATTGTVTGLTPNASYMFRVTGQIGGSHSSYESLNDLYTLAEAPGTVTVTSDSTSAVTVSWGANSNPDTTTYLVTNITTGNISTWATSTSRTFSGLSGGNSYTFGVKARNGNGVETATTTGSGSTQSGGGSSSAPPPPPPPDQITEEPTCDPQTQTCPGTPPTAPSFFFSINEGKAHTKSVTTTLTINTTFPDEIMISTSSAFTGASFQAPVATLPFVISSGDGVKTIYIKFKKTVDEIVYTFTSSTSITLDTEPPPAPIIGVAESGIENGKIVGQPLFSGTAEPGAIIRIRYESLTGGTAGKQRITHESPSALLLAGTRTIYHTTFENWLMLAGVIGDYYATADETGHWELSFPLVTTPGNYVISVASIDDAGNVSSEAPQVSFTVPQEVVIVGCTDPSASNFNPNATEDDGSCVQSIPGCTDSTSYNYNANATVDDGSCTPVIVGCRDSNATNYNPAANTSNNSCTYPALPESESETQDPGDPDATAGTETDSGDPGTDTSAQTGTDTGGTGGSGSGEELALGDTSGTGDSDFSGSGTVSQSTSTLRVALGATLKNTQQSIQSFVSSTRSAIVDAISVPVTYVTERIPEPVKQAAKKVQEVADNPQVEEANEYVVAPAVAVASTANIAVGFQLPQLILFLRYLFTQPILLLRRRRQKQWGTIYNVYTKQPVDLATIRVIDAKTGNIIRSQVTDQKGRYFIILPAGSYRVEIQKTGFTQESDVLQKQRTDIVFDRLYQVGSVIYVSEKRAELNVNIPLEPLTKDKPTKEILRVYTKQVTQYIISTVGLYISVLSYLVSPTRFVGMLVVLHVVFLYAFHVLSKKIKRKGAIGIVRDALNKHKIGRVVVRVFDASYNKLVETVVTDYRGRYGALVGPSTYYVTYEKQGYEKKKSPAIDFSSGKENTGGIIARDELLHPAAQATPDPSTRTTLPTHTGDSRPAQDPTRTLVKGGDISSEAGDTLRDIAQFGKGNDS